jgi:hypothetical protein
MGEKPAPPASCIPRERRGSKRAELSVQLPVIRVTCVCMPRFTEDTCVYTVVHTVGLPKVIEARLAWFLAIPGLDGELLGES